MFATDTASFEALEVDLLHPDPRGFTENNHIANRVSTRTVEPSLVEMTAAEIEYLSNNEDGYYLQIKARPGRPRAGTAANPATVRSTRPPSPTAVSTAMEIDTSRRNADHRQPRRPRAANRLSTATALAAVPRATRPCAYGHRQPWASHTTGEPSWLTTALHNRRPASCKRRGLGAWFVLRRQRLRRLVAPS